MKPSSSLTANISAALSTGHACRLSCFTSSIGVKMMRAVWVGLLGAVLLGGSASAGECRLDRAVLKVASQSGRMAGVVVKKPKLVGATFRATRFVESLDPVVNNGTGQERLVGYDAIEMRGRAGRFILRRDYSIGTNSETAATWRAGKAPLGPKPDWSKRTKMPSVKTGDVYASVYMGELSAFDIKVSGCT